MNLTPTRYAEAFMSEVEKNKDLLLPGDILTSASNVYTIEEVTEDGFTTVCGDAFCFDSLQLGWEIKRAANVSSMVRRNADNPSYSKWITWEEHQQMKNAWDHLTYA